MTAPSPNGGQTDRDPRGRFAKGNGGGPGNPFAAEVSKRRAKLLASIKDRDITAAIKVMRDVMARGRDGDRLAAAKLLLDRVLGPAIELDLIARIEALEAALGAVET